MNELRFSLTSFACVAALLLASTRFALAAADPLEEKFERTYPVNADVRLSVHDVDGSIRIYAAAVSEVRVQALKKAYTAERLKQIEVNVKESRDEIAIETVFPPKKTGWSLGDRSGTVEYTILVPFQTRITEAQLVNGEILVEGLRGGSAKAQLVNGWLAGHNCFGDLDLALTNGRLDVAFDWWEKQELSIKAQSVNGNIRAILPPDASVALHAETATGRIGNAFDDKKENSAGTIRSLVTSLGEGNGWNLQLQATQGNIKIDKAYP